MPSALFPAYPYDPELRLLLKAAAALALTWQQDYVGPEHVWWAIVEGEAPEGPGHQILADLDFDLAQVKAPIFKAAGVPSGRAPEERLPLTKTCLRILGWANVLRRRRKAGTMDAGHVMESILSVAINVPRCATALHLNSFPGTRPGRPEWKEFFVRGVVRQAGRAWTFPRESLADLLPAVLPGLMPWNPRHTFREFTLSGWGYRLQGLIQETPEEVLFWLRPLPEQPLLNEWWRGRFYARTLIALSRVPGGRELAPGELKRSWQITPKQLAGRLNRAFFENRRPAGRLRELQAKDVAFCESLYSILEANGQVPTGFEPEFREWLGKLPDFRYAMETDGDLAGCCGMHLFPGVEPESPEAVATQPAPDLEFMFTFGLIHPAWQGKGLGTTQVAARMVAARQQGGDVAQVSATANSVAWLERLGFRFSMIHEADSRAPGYIGRVLLTDEDTAFLEAWLGPEHRIAVPASFDLRQCES
jgi:N-acetylglutamate synthase-like GNAT family acetyltransferase